MKVLEFWDGEEWREEKWEEMRRCILLIVKEEQDRIIPSFLKYHWEMREGLGEGWIAGVKPGQIKYLIRILGEHWREELARLRQKQEKEKKKQK